MMNKKAIAAFAAGATLLAGFAMATPAFAADAANEPTVQEQNLALAQAQLDTAKETLKTKQEALKKDNDDIAAYKKLYPNLNEAGLKAQATTDAAGSGANKTAAEAYNEANKNLEKDTKAVTDAQAAVDAAQKLVDANTPKVEPSKDAKRVALAKLDEAKEKLDKAKEAKDKAFAEADAAFNAKHEAENNLKAAQRALKDYQDENAKDKGSRAYNAEVASLKKVINEANEALSAAKTKFADADKAFKEAAGKFGEALTAYAGAYKNAQTSKADVSTYPTPASLAPLSTDYVYGTNFVPSATVQPGKPGAAKPGKPGQAAGQAGANGAAAGAKTEVENKKDKDKRGNTHTGTGVGVTLTALAATMLAGMGAAVRKARH